MDQVFMSWSGGKDSCLACYLATTKSLKVSCLANMITEDGQMSMTHGQSSELLQVQSRAIGIPLVQRRTTWNGYEAEFKEMLRAFKREGINGGVFGDIDLDEHREWVERVCREVDMTPHLPLWGQRQEKLLRDFVDLGFEAIVVATRADLLEEEWLGRRIDPGFINELIGLRATKGITPCGEAGEYHTLVVDGPLFQQRLEILETRKTLKDGYWFLEVLATELKTK